MTETSKSELTKIPGVGKNMAKHLISAGYSTIASLKGQDPEVVYFSDCAYQGCHVDRCALYCYRLAVCFADNDGTLPEGKTNWWDWKD
jgi:hypothetical protein